MRALAAALAVSAAVATTGAWAAGELDAVLGKALFERNWIPAPASTDSTDGLGPLFNARGCSGCHSGGALAARFTDAPDERIAGRGLVVRFGDADGRPDPLYGHQLQNQSMQGLGSEGRVVLTRGEDGGMRVAVSLDRGPLDAATRESVRIAPPVLGRAALERIDSAAVIALADPDDRDGDGVSGRVRMVATAEGTALGRYGWKAANPALADQVADAFNLDLGLSSARRPHPYGDCTARETDCMALPTGESARLDGHELSEEMIGLVETYLKSLPLPARTADPAGSALFAASGCAACHTPALPALDGGEVAAYSDLLLHDMGPGLDDGMGEPAVASAEWRTAPLIAMRPAADRRYLHDGRAATIDAAIRAHGGEAERARTRYLALSDDERQALVVFVGGL